MYKTEAEKEARDWDLYHTMKNKVIREVKQNQIERDAVVKAQNGDDKTMIDVLNH